MNNQTDTKQEAECVDMVELLLSLITESDKSIAKHKQYMAERGIKRDGYMWYEMIFDQYEKSINEYALNHIKTVLVNRS